MENNDKKIEAAKEITIALLGKMSLSHLVRSVDNESIGEAGGTIFAQVYKMINEAV